MTVTHELVVFLYFIFEGVCGGIIFDVLRAVRHNRKVSNLAVYLEDIIFWLVMVFGVIWLSYFLDAGQIRIYMIMGVFLGMIIYFLTLTKTTCKVFDWLCRNIAWIVSFVLKIFKGANNEKAESELG